MNRDQLNALEIISSQTDIEQLREQRDWLLELPTEDEEDDDHPINGLINFLDAFLDAVEVPEQVMQSYQRQQAQLIRFAKEVKE
jgi:hypothetical protein